ncbi:reverse transcriptase family protein [Tsukamurella paurometabola]|uniref:RNA-directed DNA polymerase n=1 Tax=Tsukamurella paurometabola TaxID=2061 RepID=A0A3P8MEM2_TSUPA|nr:reverse transcriptase family protein [Tsukamurella paurometabola]MBS4100954.1 RNA-directed DNA polymerase [Tsukamurella paurometabola]UEA83347.1 reverse transcriptase family protein [Tsukamurella paurometabola]VDR40453.1 Retron-type reverse transcriptase [Tsukamurella paurometabola]
MTAVEITRRLPRSWRHAVADRVLLLTEEMWTADTIAALVSGTVPDELVGPVVEALLAGHPQPPLQVVDGRVRRPRTAPLVAALDAVRIAETLESGGPVDVPGLALPDVASVARMLDLTMPELEWFADHGRWLRHARPPLRHYRVARIIKPAGGFRLIEAPKPRLAEVQRRILRRVLDPAGAHPAARGFRPGGSVLAYASPHNGSRAVVRLDLRDCFSTVAVPRIRNVFRRLGYPAPVAAVLADLCTVATPADELRGLDPWRAATLRSRHLPQGAPSSPALVNLALHRLDARLTGLARAQGARYTRYGDDLAFSGALEPSLIAGVVPKIVAAEGLSVNPRKTRIMRAGERQELAGMVVNARAQIPRAEYDDLRALLHNAARFGAESQNREGHEDFRAHVLGRIAWVAQGNERRRERLLAMAARVRW